MENAGLPCIWSSARSQTPIRPDFEKLWVYEFAISNKQSSGSSATAVECAYFQIDQSTGTFCNCELQTSYLGNFRSGDVPAPQLDAIYQCLLKIALKPGSWRNSVKDPAARSLWTCNHWPSNVSLRAKTVGARKWLHDHEFPRAKQSQTNNTNALNNSLWIFVIVGMETVKDSARQDSDSLKRGHLRTCRSKHLIFSSRRICNSYLSDLFYFRNTHFLAEWNTIASSDFSFRVSK